ncbi:lipopolysaccharide biosynthesis protein [Nocardioides marmoriginsengisoli]|uniref:Lipopolysaccharide biosynthesis protein n=1 Tax=Nocardioides marmoriginsengisoli TaxID=661483 RepID=A0A3N0CSW3_9ACTN|nr:lipopolysaccharide biosynthesis protein [Nocardioides marmoriginsengisoli]
MLRTPSGAADGEVDSLACWFPPRSGNQRTYASRVREPDTETPAPEDAATAAGESSETDEVTSERPAQLGDTVTWIAIVAAGIFAQLLVTINGVLAARMLGVEGRGQVVLVVALSTMASQLTLGGGLPNALTKLLAERGVTTRDGVGHLVPQWLLISLVPSTIAAGYLLYLERDSSGGTKYALAIALAVMAIQTMGLRVLIGAMLGEGTPLLSFTITNFAPQAAVTAALGLAFAFGARLNAVELLAVMIGSALLTSAARLFALRKPTRNPKDRIEGKEVWALTRQNHVGSVGPIDGLSIDRTLVGSLLGNAQLGLYSAAFALAGLTNIIGGCLSMVVLPRVAVVQSDPEAERVAVRRWLSVSAGLILACVVTLAVLAEPVLRIAFGRDYFGDHFTATVHCAYWLIAAGGLLSFRRVLIAVLQARGRGGWASWIEIALTPFVVLGVWIASIDDSLLDVGITMFAVGAIGCLMLGTAAHRSRPTGDGPEAGALPPELPITT